MSQSDTHTGQTHLSPEEIVSYIDQTITLGMRTQVESHLAECQGCLAEVLEVRRLLRGPGLGPEPRHLG